MIPFDGICLFLQCLEELGGGNLKNDKIFDLAKFVVTSMFMGTGVV